ncbi:MAG: hypothetical protein KGD64_10975 [Candidatus Heimdallarchaeota archaeon]|nr:hypothetical protein [Candidatus Heimdallarchaeota archaeon]
MFGSYLKGLIQIEALMEKGDLEKAMHELNMIENDVELNEDEKLACMLLNSHILNKHGNFDKSLMLSKFAFRKSMELNNPLLVVDSTITFMESVKGLGMLEDVIAKDTKEFLQMVERSQEILKTIKNLKKNEKELRTSHLTILKGILSQKEPQMMSKKSILVDQVKGLGKKALVLAEAGIKTAEDLANASVEELVKINGIGAATAPKLIENAKQLIQS